MNFMTEYLKELMRCLDDIREDLTEKLEQDCTPDEGDIVSGVITNLSESIDDIGMYLSEASE